MKKPGMFVIGFLLVIAGLVLVFRNWAVLVAMFKGAAGVLIALIGVVIMFAASPKK